MHIFSSIDSLLFQFSWLMFFFFSFDLFHYICLAFISEILILGCGRHIEPVSPELRRFIRSTGMKLEAIDSVLISIQIFLIFLVAPVFAVVAVKITRNMEPCCEL